MGWIMTPTPLDGSRIPAGVGTTVWAALLGSGTMLTALWGQDELLAPGLPKSGPGYGPSHLCAQDSCPTLPLPKAQSTPKNTEGSPTAVGLLSSIPSGPKLALSFKGST